MRMLLTTLATLALIYGGVCLLAFLFQERLVFFPYKGVHRDPSALGLAFEEVELETADGERLAGWWIPAEDPRGALLFLHGNAGNVADRLESASVFRAMGLSVLLVDYRGYGGSSGSPDEDGLYADGAAMWQHLTRERGIAAEHVVLYGESLGCAVALELARRQAPGALVLESGFTSVPDVGADAYPFLPVRLLSRIRFDNAAKIGAVEAPILVVHSPRDEIVPFEHARRLIEATGGRARLLETELGHNDGGFLRRTEWRLAVGEFVVEALAP